jgi:hypothetical protein
MKVLIVVRVEGEKTCDNDNGEEIKGFQFLLIVGHYG